MSFDPCARDRDAFLAFRERDGCRRAELPSPAGLREVVEHAIDRLVAVDPEGTLVGRSHPVVGAPGAAHFRRVGVFQQQESGPDMSDRRTGRLNDLATGFVQVAGRDSLEAIQRVLGQCRSRFRPDRGKVGAEQGTLGVRTCLFVADSDPEQTGVFRWELHRRDEALDEGIRQFPPLDDLPQEPSRIGHAQSASEFGAGERGILALPFGVPGGEIGAEVLEIRELGGGAGVHGRWNRVIIWNAITDKKVLHVLES